MEDQTVARLLLCRETEKNMNNLHVGFEITVTMSQQHKNMHVVLTM